MFRTVHSLVLAATAVSLLWPHSLVNAADKEVTPEQVHDSISRGQHWLKSQQKSDGSFKTAKTLIGRHNVGVASLALLALVNSGVKKNDPAMKDGLKFLRKQDPLPSRTYDASLMLMVLAAAGDGTDKFTITQLAAMLEAGQQSDGGWDYDCKGKDNLGRSDRSNTQFAVLALRDAVNAGVSVKRSTWLRIKRYWEDGQNGGAWGYTSKGSSPSGSMTVAGIASLSITTRMLRDQKDATPDGTPICCRDEKPNRALELGIAWLSGVMSRRRAVAYNYPNGKNVLYYLYGLERAGRMTGRRFFGGTDWYRAGAQYLVRQQRRVGFWQGNGNGETDPTIGTSLALLFLSKGLAPVLINKLKYGHPQRFNPNEVVGNNWNRQQHDARNITEYITTRDKWPKLLTWQNVEMHKVARKDVSSAEALEALEQAKVLLITGADEPETLINQEKQYRLLKAYIDRGGFILAAATCEQNGGFHKNIQRLVARIFSDKNGKPDPNAKLVKLDPKTHAIFRAEHDLTEFDDLQLYGVEYGCRTAMVYVPVRTDGFDLPCLWNKWSRLPMNKVRVNARYWKLHNLALKLGENILAYATGREPPEKLHARAKTRKGVAGKIERGLLQVAQIIHGGQWNVAPRALRNLLIGMNEAHGLTAAENHKNLTPADDAIFTQPVLYMHGRTPFSLSKTAKDQLRKYLTERGGLLFADACCGSRDFDKSFRELMGQLFPKREFKRIPLTHELFSKKIGFDIRKVHRRMPESSNKKSKLIVVTKEVDNYLEGIEIDGRLVVIYSKYDISCALEQQAAITCSGYTEKDAMRIGINILSYALLQDVRYSRYFE